MVEKRLESKGFFKKLLLNFDLLEKTSFNISKISDFPKIISSKKDFELIPGLRFFYQNIVFFSERKQLF